MSLKDGQAVVLPAEEKTFDPTEIPRAVKDAGFSPGDIEVSAAGILRLKGDFLQLEMSGRVKEFVLAGGAKVDELEKRSDLLGQRLRVTGKLHPFHADKPPGLTVDAWEALEP